MESGNSKKNKASINAKSVPRGLFGLVGYFLAVALPVFCAVLLDEQLLSKGPVYFALSVTGIAAFSIVSIQFVLQARVGWLKKQVGSKLLFKLHRVMPIVALALALGHLGLLVWSRGNWNLVLLPRVNWPIFLGRVCIASLAIMLIYSLFRNRIPINAADWRWFHNALAWTILITGFFHGITLGASFEHAGFTGIWTAYFFIAVLAWLASNVLNRMH